MKLLKPLIMAALLSNTLASSVAPERVKWMDRMFYTVNKDLKLEAPVWINTEVKRNEYGSIFMKSLIKQAHAVASDYLKYKDIEAYNSFMMLALTFPLHEGLYMSFRETFDQKGLCNEEANSGDIMFKETKQKIYESVAENFDTIVDDKERLKQLSLLKKIDKENYDKLKEIIIQDYTRDLLDDKKDSIANTDKPSNYRHFAKYLKGGTNPLIVDCSSVADRNDIRQLIRGGDGTDIGPVQLSIRWHFDEFIAKRKYLNLDQTFEYGLKYIHEGFKKLYYDAQVKSKKDFECIKTSGKVDLERLVRATWAGKYNQGQVSKSCRINDAEGVGALESKLAQTEALEKKAKKASEKSKLAAQKAALEDKIKKIKKHPDFHFAANLNRVIDFKSKSSIGYNDSISFAPNKEVKNAINDIISNFNNGKANGNQFENIQKLIK